MIIKVVKKTIVAASISSVILSIACSKAPTLPVNNSFGGAWATVQVSSSYQYIGHIMKDVEFDEDKSNIVPAIIENHYFVDKSDPMEDLTKLLIVSFTKFKNSKHAYTREANFDKFKQSIYATVGVTKVGDIEVPFMIREQMSLSSQVNSFLREKKYELTQLYTFYTVRFAKVCSSNMSVNIFFMQLDNSKEQIVESAKNAFTFVKQ
jgi:hypothetical protein